MNHGQPGPPMRKSESLPKFWNKATRVACEPPLSAEFTIGRTWLNLLHLLIGRRGYIGRATGRRRCSRISHTLVWVEGYRLLVAGAGSPLQIVIPTLPISMAIRSCVIEVSGGMRIHKSRMTFAKRLASLSVDCIFATSSIPFFQN